MDAKTVSSIPNFKKKWEKVKRFFLNKLSSQYIPLEYYFVLTRIQRNEKQKKS